MCATWQAPTSRPACCADRIKLLQSACQVAKLGIPLGLMTSAYERGCVPEIQVRHRLRIAREYAGLEQSELAAHIGVSRTAISNAEKGRSSPRRIVLNAWALACGVPVSWLITGEGPNNIDPNGGGAPAAPIPADQSLLSGLNRGPLAYLVAGRPAQSGWRDYPRRDDVKPAAA